MKPANLGLVRGFIIALAVNLGLTGIYLLLSYLNLIPKNWSSAISSWGILIEVILFFGVIFLLSKKESKQNEENLRKEIEDLKKS